MQKQRPEKGNAPEVESSGASSVHTYPAKKGLNMNDFTRVALNGATPDLQIIEGQITTTSNQVAEHFGKVHRDVVRAIENLECSRDFRLRNFAQSSFEAEMPNGGKRKHKAYRLTRDGFVFLAMGFTGKEAAQWKEAYITAFNKMEQELLARTTRPTNPAIDYDRINPAQAQDLKELVHLIVDAKVQGFAETWARLHRKFRVNSYLELPAARYQEARDYLLGKLVDDTARGATVNETVENWVRRIEEANGYPCAVFMPLVEAVLRKQGRRLVELRPGRMLVDRQKLLDLRQDLCKLRARIDGMGVLESDLPPAWWAQHHISG